MQSEKRQSRRLKSSFIAPPSAITGYTPVYTIGIRCFSDVSPYSLFISSKHHVFGRFSKKYCHLYPLLLLKSKSRDTFWITGRNT